VKGICCETEMLLPKNNVTYSKKEYWEERFANETDFEWLVSYNDVSNQIKPYIKNLSSKILVVGCGNSSFSSDLYDDGYPNITNIDYSDNVISCMKQRHSAERPTMTWQVMDMTDMSAFDNDTFDCVIDKAAMDAIMTNEGDVWSPDSDVVDKASVMCHHISRILKKGGYHLQISFAQPHFREKYLLGQHSSNGDNDDELDPLVSIVNELEYSNKFGWDYKMETIGGDGCFHNFLYIMQMQR